MGAQFGHPSGERLLLEIRKAFVRGSIFEKKDRHILFVCGGPTGDTENSLRASFLRWARRELPDIIPILAETAYRESLSEGPLKLINLSKFEKLLARVSDCVLIFPESAGSYAEIGLFSSHLPISKKMIVANDYEHHSRDSFLNLGPIANINARSWFQPAIPIIRDRVESGFINIKDRLSRLHYRSKRRQFHYKPYKALPFEDKLLAVLATMTLLRVLDLDSLEQSIKVTFDSANRQELWNLLSILVTAGLVSKSTESEYFFLPTGVKQFLDFELFPKEDLIGRTTFYYRKYQPQVLQHLGSV